MFTLGFVESFLSKIFLEPHLRSVFPEMIKKRYCQPNPLYSTLQVSVPSRIIVSIGKTYSIRPHLHLAYFRLHFLTQEKENRDEFDYVLLCSKLNVVASVHTVLWHFLHSTFKIVNDTLTTKVEMMRISRNQCVCFFKLPWLKEHRTPANCKVFEKDEHTSATHLSFRTCFFSMLLSCKAVRLWSMGCVKIMSLLCKFTAQTH